MSKGFKLYNPRKITPPDPSKYLTTSLNGTFGPAVLLSLEPVHIGWKFCRGNHISQINKFPSLHLCAVTQIQIFSYSVVLPTSRIDYRTLTPDPCCTIKIEESTTPTPRRLFHGMVAIKKKSLNAGQNRILFIDMTPTGLNHAYFFISEKMNHFMICSGWMIKPYLHGLYEVQRLYYLWSNT